MGNNIDEKTDEEIEKIVKVRIMILDKHKREIKERKDVVGELECPYCGGKIYYGIANSVNEHIHAFCENGCVKWIE